MNNLLMMLMQAARNGGNLMGMLQQMAGQNPAAAQAVKMLQGKSPEQIRSMVQNMCRERGTTPEQVARQMGLMK